MGWQYKTRSDYLEEIKKTKEEIKGCKDYKYYKDEIIQTKKLHIKLLKEQMKERGL
jgi:hypothetical protein